jgi:hypothetical protein
MQNEKEIAESLQKIAGFYRLVEKLGGCSVLVDTALDGATAGLKKLCPDITDTQARELLWKGN